MKRLAFAGILLVVACGALRGSKYYEVRDLSGGRIYYTTQLEKLDTGYVKLTDAKTHEEVTIPVHMVTEISKDQFNAAVGK